MSHTPRLMKEVYRICPWGHSNNSLHSRVVMDGSTCTFLHYFKSNCMKSNIWVNIILFFLLISQFKACES